MPIKEQEWHLAIGLLGANRPISTYLSPTNPYSLNHLVRPMTPMSQKHVTGKISNTTPAPPDITWAGQVKAPLATE
jgi:hypothetical protein